MSSLIGREIVSVREMTEDELDREGWTPVHGQAPPVVELDDGSEIFPSRDPEGNGPGALFGMTSDGEPVAHSPN